MESVMLLSCLANVAQGERIEVIKTIPIKIKGAS